MFRLNKQEFKGCLLPPVHHDMPEVIEKARKEPSVDNLHLAADCLYKGIKCRRCIFNPSDKHKAIMAEWASDLKRVNAWLDSNNKFKWWNPRTWVIPKAR